jgi:phosphoribosyl 1,2-cyclic phosphodiesterase
LTTVHTLASGSSGNAALICCGATRLLLDAGISCRRITAALRALGTEPADLSAILITHTHSDHISGLATIVKNWDVPICASAETARGIAYRVAGAERLLRPFAWGQTLHIGSAEVTPFPTSHDAPGSAGYRLGDAGVLTDTGYVTPAARETLLGVPVLVLEANHDVDRLRAGPYPYYLKARILSDEGHLSNDAAAAFAAESAAAGTREIVLAHLSQENNTPALALEAVSAALAAAGLQRRLCVAPRGEASPCYGGEAAEC